MSELNQENGIIWKYEKAEFKLSLIWEHVFKKEKKRAFNNNSPIMDNTQKLPLICVS